MKVTPSSTAQMHEFGVARLVARLATALMLIGLLLIVPSGCSILPKAVSPEVYRLPATTLPPAQAAVVNWSLRIDTPQADRTINDSRIVVLPQGDVVSNYQGARWSDHVPTLLRNRLIQAFRDDARITALSSDDMHLHADYVLSGDLNAFQSEYRGGRPVIVLRYDARLIRSNGLRIVAMQRFEVTLPVNGTAVPQVVAAFGQANDVLATRVLAWTLMQPSNELASRPSERSD